MRKYKYQKYQLLIVFILLIILPLANSFFGFYKTERKSENRSFKDSIEFNFKEIDNFPEEFEEYVKDNFSFRTPLLNIYHNISFHLFKVSPYPDKTIIGSDDWYFVAGRDVEVFEGKRDFSETELYDLTKEWGRRIGYADSLGIKIYWLICPLKHEIYSEHLPMNIYKGKKITRSQIVQKHLEKDFPRLIINPINQLKKHKSQHKLFYKLDNHWNLKAAEITSKIVVKHIRKDFPENEIYEIPNYKWKDSIFQKGIHYKVLGIDNLQEIDAFPIIDNERAKAIWHYGFAAPKGFPYPWNYEKRYKMEDKGKALRILVIRDSFGASLIPFLKESFYESVFIFDAWKYQLDKEIIETVKPDILLYASHTKFIEAFIK